MNAKYFILLMCLFLFPGLGNTLDQYNPRVQEWKKINHPEDRNSKQWFLWNYAASFSSHNWKVYKKNGCIYACLLNEQLTSQTFSPEIELPKDDIPGVYTFQKLENGWLGGCDKGEFSGSLWWFPDNGKKKYKISDHRVKQFIKSGDDIFAIQGLAHLGTSQGSMLKISRDGRDKPWKVSTVIRLPQSPEAFQRLKNSEFIVLLSNSLAKVDAKVNFKFLLENAGWDTLYPNSLEISQDEKTVYIGMRQYVAVFELDTNQLNFYVPDDRLMNNF